jgi:sulfite reductase beta subunit-like hemoprotein
MGETEKITKEEKIKKELNPFDIWDRIVKYSQEGYQTIEPTDFMRMRWFGLYQHRQKDGNFMLRVKVPGGHMTSAQLRGISEITRDYAQGYCDITTRQDFQLHYIHISKSVEVLTKLKNLGMTTLNACGDTTRNVVGCAVAGVDKNELFDASPIIDGVTQFFLGNKEFSDLPRKYKICITACTRSCTQPEINDVGLVGAVKKVDGKSLPGFNIRVGGGLSTIPHFSEWINVWVPVDKAITVVKAITTIFRDHGYRAKRTHARLKFLLMDWGPVKFREVLQSLCDWELEPAMPMQEFDDEFIDHIGVNPQKQPGLYYVGVTILGGRISVEQMRLIADLAEKYGNGTVRNTIRQNIVIIGVPEKNLDAVRAELDKANLKYEGSSFWRGMVTCTGKEFCALAITETKEKSMEIVRWLDAHAQFDEPIRIHINGCPNSCAQHHIADIGLQGALTKVNGKVVEAYEFGVGGGMGKDQGFVRIVARKIPIDVVPERIKVLLEYYKANKKNGENFRQFVRSRSDDELRQVIWPTSEPATSNN